MSDASQPTAARKPSFLDDPHEREGMTWLVVVVAGLATGLFIATGPLGWWFAGKLRKQALAEQRKPAQTTTIAWGLGIASSIMGAAGCALTTLVLVIQLGLMAAWGGGSWKLVDWVRSEITQMQQQHERDRGAQREQHEQRLRQMQAQP